MTRGTRPTIREVAKSAGVAVGTVSRVLNGYSSVRPEIELRVRNAIQNLGYTPNAVAQSMRIGSTFTMGCVLRDIAVPQLAEFIRSAHETLDEAGFSLLISNSDGKEARERELLSRLARRQADGVMTGPYTPVSGEFEMFLRNLGIPIVLVDRDPTEWADGVMTDHRSGTRLAVEHLLGLGHRRVALITGGSHLYPAKERIEGYRAAYENRDLPVEPTLIHVGSFLADAGFRTASRLLGLHPRPSAIIAGGIDMLSGVLRAIRSHGLRIPRDVSVIASGNSELADLHTPPISIVTWDQAEVGRIAANLLLDRLSSGRDQVSHIVLPNEFVIRESVSLPFHAA